MDSGCPTVTGSWSIFIPPQRNGILPTPAFGWFLYLAERPQNFAIMPSLGPFLLTARWCRLGQTRESWVTKSGLWGRMGNRAEVPGNRRRPRDLLPYVVTRRQTIPLHFWGVGGKSQRKGRSARHLVSASRAGEDVRLGAVARWTDDLCLTRAYEQQNLQLLDNAHRPEHRQAARRT